MWFPKTAAALVLAATIPTLAHAEAPSVELQKRFEATLRKRFSEAEMTFAECVRSKGEEEGRSCHDMFEYGVSVALIVTRAEYMLDIPSEAEATSYAKAATYYRAVTYMRDAREQDARLQKAAKR